MTDFGVIEPVFDDVVIPEPHAYSTVCDEEHHTFLVWFTCWPADGMDPMSPVDPNVDYEHMVWPEYAAQNVGWGGVVANNSTSRPDELLEYLFENGIAPNQPFCVRLSNFHGRWVGYETPEWDEDWESEFVCVEQWGAARIVAAWEEWINA